MNLNKLYISLTKLYGEEIPIYIFLAYLDMGVRELLTRYPKKIIMPHGEYIAPESLSDCLMLDEVFHNALVFYILGSLKGDSEAHKKSTDSAERAYILLWSRAAKGKRIKGVKW